MKYDWDEEKAAGIRMEKSGSFCSVNLHRRDCWWWFILIVETPSA
jgi:hypothetical protein